MATTGNLFTFLSAGNAVDRAFSIYLNRWKLFTQLALVVVIPQILLKITLQKTLIMDDSGAFAENAEATFQTMSPKQVAMLGIEIAFSFLFGIIVRAAIFQVVAEYYSQKLSTFKGSLVLAFNRSCAIFGFGLLYSAAVLVFGMAFASLIWLLILYKGPDFLGTLLCVSAAAFVVYVMLSLTIVLPILVIEKESPIGAVRRCFELLPTYRCYVFCSMLLLGVVVIFTSTLYQALVGAIFGVSMLTTVFGGLSAVVTLPLQTM
ncbi:hypothetical protein FisN_22Hu176 [Fistulifera solaris]|uniref:Uncharacterized protein n=1 Tax=Fistulifera solaris TaxID=1519565 RepID=A0A1Z5JPL7_FISSO|nr:hypothetical protein FisN_22Hu176 [Fistulifera solaris]|eukprot:GAX15970.1 hypothetical protein FisN_22Hu176 [Fistulifera solaris]